MGRVHVAMRFAGGGCKVGVPRQQPGVGSCHTTPLAAPPHPRFHSQPAGSSAGAKGAPHRPSETACVRRWRREGLKQAETG